MCDRIFDHQGHLSRHVKTCCTEKKEIYAGGKYRRDRTLFERLEREGIIVPEQDRYYEYFTCFDFEAIQMPRDEIIHGRTLISKHIPATFSVASNIPDHREPVHRASKGDPQKLVDELIQILLQQQERASMETRNKFIHVFEALDKELERVETLSSKVKEKRQKKITTFARIPRTIL